MQQDLSWISDANHDTRSVCKLSANTGSRPDLHSSPCMPNVLLYIVSLNPIGAAGGKLALQMLSLITLVPNLSQNENIRPALDRMLRAAASNMSDYWTRCGREEHVEQQLPSRKCRHMSRRSNDLDRDTNAIQTDMLGACLLKRNQQSSDRNW